MLTSPDMQGRITEKHLGLAERTFPGIGELYASLEDKPATFLQLVWIYEELMASLEAEMDTAEYAQLASA